MWQAVLRWLRRFFSWEDQGGRLPSSLSCPWGNPRCRRTKHKKVPSKRDRIRFRRVDHGDV